MTSESNCNFKMYAVAPDVWGLKDIFVNLYMIRNPTNNNWVLVDTGLKTSAVKIKEMAAGLFGPNSRPSAIILTHGHFDHTGSLKKLAEEWNVPVYAHHLEKPYLTGASSYPPPDPSVGGGMMAMMSFVYPKGPIDIGDRLEVLQDEGAVPFLHEWRYIHTPGHTPGHISLFRDSDKVLIVGDAFVTTKSESALSTMLQTQKVCGPPKYFTCDWQAAEASVRKLAYLEPEVVATGHGRPMRGAEMLESLHQLSWQFGEKAVPRQGRYVDEPALADEEGVQYVPPNTQGLPTLVKLALVSATFFLGYGIMSGLSRRFSHNGVKNGKLQHVS